MQREKGFSETPVTVQASRVGRIGLASIQICGALLIALTVRTAEVGAATEPDTSGTVQVVQENSVAEASVPRGAVEIDNIEDGRLLFRTRARGKFMAGPRSGTHAEISVHGPIVRTTVTQRFHNPTDHWLESIYVFPLPADAAVDSLDVLVGDRHIRGEIHETHMATQLYEAAAQAGHAAAIVERVRHGVFRSNVANIPPSAEIVVRISYQSHAHREGDQWSLTFPTALLPLTDPVSNTSTASEPPPVTPGGAQGARLHDGVAHLADDPFSIDIRLMPGGPVAAIDSPTHSIRTEDIPSEGTVTWSPSGQESHGAHVGHGSHVGHTGHTDHAVRRGHIAHRIQLDGGQAAPGRDFHLNWTVRAANQPTIEAFRERLDAHDFHLLVLRTPESDNRSRQRRERAETTFLVDISGSMSGTPLAEAKRALDLALAQLPTGDNFRLLAFDDKLHPQHSDPSPVRMNPRTRKQAREWVEQLTVIGGTDIAGALTEALAQPTAQGYRGRVVLLTDGGARYDRDTLARLRDQLGNRRLFVVGLGAAPNGYLLQKLATLGRGRLQIVRDPAELPEAIDRLVGPGSTPALFDLDLQAADGRPIEIWPEVLPDLFPGESLFVAVRTPATEPEFLLQAQTSRGPKTLLSTPAAQGEGIARNFAAQKVASLEQLFGESPRAERQALREEILATALPAGLISQFTSLVAIDDTPLRDDGSPLIAHARQATLPENWNLPTAFRNPEQATVRWAGDWRDTLVASDRFLTEEERKLALSVATATPAGRYAQAGGCLLLLTAICAWLLNPRAYPIPTGRDGCGTHRKHAKRGKQPQASR
jgi:Ca-activated chloride channel family protein